MDKFDELELNGRKLLESFLIQVRLGKFCVLMQP